MRTEDIILNPLPKCDNTSALDFKENEMISHFKTVHSWESFYLRSAHGFIELGALPNNWCYKESIAQIVKSVKIYSNNYLLKTILVQDTYLLFGIDKKINGLERMLGFGDVADRLITSRCVSRIIIPLMLTPEICSVDINILKMELEFARASDFVESIEILSEEQKGLIDNSFTYWIDIVIADVSDTNLFKKNNFSIITFEGNRFLKLDVKNIEEMFIIMEDHTWSSGKNGLHDISAISKTITPTSFCCIYLCGREKINLLVDSGKRITIYFPKNGSVEECSHNHYVS